MKSPRELFYRFDKLLYILLSIEVPGADAEGTEGGGAEELMGKRRAVKAGADGDGEGLVEHNSGFRGFHGIQSERERGGGLAGVSRAEEFHALNAF